MKVELEFIDMAYGRIPTNEDMPILHITDGDAVIRYNLTYKDAGEGSWISIKDIKLP